MADSKGGYKRRIPEGGFQWRIREADAGGGFERWISKTNLDEVDSRIELKRRIPETDFKA